MHNFLIPFNFGKSRQNTKFHKICENKILKKMPKNEAILQRADSMYDLLKNQKPPSLDLNWFYLF